MEVSRFMPSKQVSLFSDQSRPLDGSTSQRAAPSGYYIAQNFPGRATGWYWIQSPTMPNPLQMYVDMTEEGGGYDFYFITAGPSVNYGCGNHGGKSLGLDIVYPRSKFHWRAMSNAVLNARPSGNYGDYFQTTYAITSASPGNYTGSIMRSTRYGSGTTGWGVPDGGRWWLRDTTSGEPNGDYLANAFLGLQAGGYTHPNPYNLTDIAFNDGNANYGLGNYYLVSTNAKP